MKINEIYNCSGLVEYINEIGFLPLLHMGLDGWSAEEAVDEDQNLPIHPPARRRMGMAAMGMERRHHPGERMRIRQVL